MEQTAGEMYCRVEQREYLGKAALVGIAVREYATTVEDLWEAITVPERIARWFLPVEGDLRLGGRYQLKGNAGGTITRCEAPRALELTWEFMGGTSWVKVTLAPVGKKARLTLEHIAHREGIGEAHLKKYGPAATGIGWDLGLEGLRRHFLDPLVALDPAAFEAWTLSDEGKAFVRKCGEAWAEAHIAAGAEPDEARAQAERTIAFYTGA